jgi:hypothetical protein
MFCSVNCAQTPAENLPHRDADWAGSRYEQQVDMLGQMAEAGLKLALNIVQQAETTAAEEAALGYARVSKSVRMTLMLQTQAIKAIQHLESHAHVRLDSAEATQRKDRVERIVERIAEQEHGDAEEVERLVAETAERLDQDDIYGDVLSRPLSELIAEICKDIGLDPDWPRLADEAWAREELRGGAAGWPLASLAESSASAAGPLISKHEAHEDHREGADVAPLVPP